MKKNGDQVGGEFTASALDRSITESTHARWKELKKEEPLLAGHVHQKAPASTFQIAGVLGADAKAEDLAQVHGELICVMVFVAEATRNAYQTQLLQQACEKMAASEPDDSK